MSRNFWINAHLLTAAFLTPLIVLMAISGGLYLIGIKGDLQQSDVTLPPSISLDLKSPSLESDVREILATVDTGYAFEYLKVKGNTLYTRPTSRPHYEIVVSAGELSLKRNEPSLQKSLVELHKGHGPTAYKTLQKAMAAGLVFILLSGMWLGFSSRILRGKTLTMVILGCAATAVLALM